MKYVDPFGTDCRVFQSDGRNFTLLSERQFNSQLESFRKSNILHAPGGNIELANPNGSITRIGTARWFDGAAAQRATNAVGFLNCSIAALSDNAAGEAAGAFLLGPLLSRLSPVIGALLGGRAAQGVVDESVSLYHAGNPEEEA